MAELETWRRNLIRRVRFGYHARCTAIERLVALQYDDRTSKYPRAAGAFGKHIAYPDASPL